MWQATAGAPEQMAAAVQMANALELRPAGAVAAVVACGVGGGGSAADVLAALAAPELAVPVVTTRSHELPAFVGPHSLVVCITSSDGTRTDEAPALALAAVERGAAVVAVGDGGALDRVATDPSSRVVVVPLPAPAGPVRAALGALSAGPLVVLERLGLLDAMSTRLTEAAGELARSRDQLMRPGNVAEEVARRVGRTLPLVHGAAGPSAVAARWWKHQVNLNAKTPAFWAAQPDLCHDEVAGWGQHGDVTRQVLTVVTLRHGNEHPRVARRFEMVRELMEEVVANVIEVRTDATDDVVSLFDLAFVGDFVSLHLAAQAGVDPGPVPVLDELAGGLPAG